MNLFMATPKSRASNGGTGTAVAEKSSNQPNNPERERVFNAFRQYGYLEGDLHPLGFMPPRPTPELQIDSEYTREARTIYSSTIGVEINHIYAPERRRWIYERMESHRQLSRLQKKIRNAFSTCSSVPMFSSRSCSNVILAASASRSRASPR